MSKKKSTLSLLKIDPARVEQFVNSLRGTMPQQPQTCMRPDVCTCGKCIAKE